jgi:hypothetical protein
MAHNRMTGSPNHESMRELLTRREAELVQRATELREQLAPIEQDLADIRRAKAVLGMEVSPKPRSRLHSINAQDKAIDGDFPYSRLTIKGLAVKALDDHFRGAGATTQELLNFFREAWGRDDIDRASLSAQLSRLNLDDGAIVRCGTKWLLVPESISEDDLKSWGVIPPWAVVPDRFKTK